MFPEGSESGNTAGSFRPGSSQGTVLTSNIEGSEDRNTPPRIIPSAPERESASIEEVQLSPGTRPEDSTTKSQGSRKFNPLFVVIEDPVTGEHHHPYVHYVFSDDDAELMTNAVLHTLDQSSALESHSQYQQRNQAEMDMVKDRVLILDLDDSGQTVVSAQSLSRDWQIIHTDILAAPTFSNSTHTEDNGLMLRIKGVEQLGLTRDGTLSTIINDANNKSDEELINALSALSSRFHEEQSSLQKILDQS